MDNEKLKGLVKQARDNVTQNNIGVDAPVNYRFGETLHFTKNGTVNGLFKVDENGNQLEGVGMSVYSDSTLENRSGFASLIEGYIRKNKKSI